MEARSHKINLGKVALTVTYFADELGVGRREPLGEVFDKLSSIHHHAEQEIFFVLDGEMELVTEDKNLRFKDSAVLLPPDIGHYTGVDAERLFVIYMSINHTEGDAGTRLLERLLREVIGLEINEDEKFYLDKLSNSRNSYDCPHLLSLLFSELLARVEPDIQGVEKRGNAAGKYSFVLEDYVERHYSEKLCLSDLASSLHLCEKQVSRVIKREYGCSFTEYVNRKRMSVATMMLKHTEMTVSEIARAVGFESDNYFYKVFKERQGLTPNEYRNEQKNGS